MNGERTQDFSAPKKTKARSTKNKSKGKNRKQKRQPSPMPVLLKVDTEENAQQQQQLNVLYQNQNLHMELNKSIELKNITTMNSKNEASENPSSICKMCHRTDEVCLNLQHHHPIVLTVSDITRLPSWNIREILTSVCSRCIVYINTLTESSSKLRMRCEQAVHQQTLELAPPTPDTSPNNFLQAAISLLDDTPGHSNYTQQRNRYGPGYFDDSVVNDLPTLPSATSTPPPASPQMQPILANPTIISRSPSPDNPGQNSMLEPLGERPVSPLNTESGGGGKINKRSYQRVQVIPTQMSCPHCNRAYWRKDYFNKHMRRCGAKFRYAKSLGAAGTRARSISRLDLLDTVSVTSEGNEQITTNHIPRIFRCNSCAVTVESIGKLRAHKKIHLQRYYCDICGEEYTTLNEYEFHRAICTAKLEVFEKGMENIRNDVHSPVIMPSRRKTRSFSRAQSVAPSIAPSRDGSCRSSKSRAAKKIKTPKKVTKQKTTSKKKKQQKEQQEPLPSQEEQQKPQLSQEDVQSTITNFAKRHKDLYTEIESDDNDDKVTTVERQEELYDDDDDEDDDVSQVDTLYSKRLLLTNHWVEEHSHSSHSHLSQGDNFMDDFIDIPFQSAKEYDLYLLDRLKNEVKLSSITCFVSECKFRTNTLTKMMWHDYVDHFKKPWFYCNKCGNCFTSKVFLDYHLDLQNKGRYVCYKCGNQFEYQHQLDRHFIQHARRSDDVRGKYYCYYCNYEFLYEDELLKHCDEENHSWHKEKSYIQIDHSMTIVNKVPKKPAKTRRNICYKVRILEMVLNRMPSKRCIPIEKYRPYLPPKLQNSYVQKEIGHVEFRYPSNPNCVGCL